MNGSGPAIADARGVSRSFGSGPDAGAVEMEQPFIFTDTGSDVQNIQVGNHASIGPQVFLSEELDSLVLPGASVTFTVLTPSGQSPLVTFSNGFTTYTTTTGDDGTATALPLYAGTTSGTVIVEAKTGNLTHDFTITVTPGPLDHYSIEPITVSPSAGNDFSLHVTPVDQYGNIVNDTGTVSINVSGPGSGLFPTTYTFSGAGTTETISGFNFRVSGTYTATLTPQNTSIPASQTTVSVTPGPLDHYRIETITVFPNSGDDFSLHVTPVDQYGNAVDDAGTVSVAVSGPGSAAFPSTYTFSDTGSTETISGFNFDSPGNYTVTLTPQNTSIPASQVQVNVANLPPVFTDLHISTGSGDIYTQNFTSTVAQGQTFTLYGSFLDLDARGHTVFISWGDGSTQKLTLSGSQSNFSVDHVYTTGLPGMAPTAHPTIQATVTDASAASDSDSVAVTVNDTTPFVNIGDDQFLNQGDTLTRTGSFDYVGQGSFTAEVNYGDGSGWQPLALTPYHTFTLSHQYTEEGSFVVAVQVDDGFGPPGGNVFYADVMLQQVGDHATATVPADTTADVKVAADGVVGELHVESHPLRSAIIVASVPPDVADSLGNVFTVGAAAIGGAYDVRAINVGTRDSADITFNYVANGDIKPTLSFFDKSQGRQIVLPPTAYTVDEARHQIKIHLDNNSFPRLQDLNGTVFTITVPVPDPPRTEQPQQIFPVVHDGVSVAGLIAISSVITNETTTTGGGGPLGGQRDAVVSDPSESSQGSGGDVRNEKVETKAPAVKPASSTTETSDLPPAPDVPMTYPAGTFSTPGSRRDDFGPPPSTPPYSGGGEEEEQEQQQVQQVQPAAVFEDADVAETTENLDQTFSSLGEEASPMAWLMVPAVVATWPVSRRLVPEGRRRVLAD
jgi:hypothetical protein